MIYKKIILISLIILAVAYTMYFILQTLGKKTSKISINDHVIRVEIASSPISQSKGLSNRTSLKDDEGMLFTFPRKDLYSFWMKEMNFPLDFIWIDKETVVDVSRNIPVFTSGELQTYSGRLPYDKVLEISAGSADKYGIKIGDKVTF